ncbi:MAG: hypothetical protein OZSIB_2702 [Candidatus Ozemobacter sibiricus]|uniref:Alginate export domain-containing protein n=1 Tax=Candidatus Ozemobacter sibiricus TaxID=2268124 RepID=A0A367ZRQ3_9BACT|nr:MAG: hypothetical protein OZSIB_2702 [Candidatus Ozemobacter sibiricus]
MVLLTVLLLFPMQIRAEEDQPERPQISGAHSWRYNKFSSYDQLRVNFEREYGKGQKALVSVHGLYYQEDDNKTWSAYLGESYYKFRAGRFDFKLGQLVETLGSGDKISWVDKLNSRRYHNGLANDYNRDKREQPCAKVTYNVNSRMSLDVHYLPVFQASELTSIYSKWATAFQKYLATALFFGARLQREDDTSLREQFHVGFNSSFKKYELRYHYFRFKERIPVIEAVGEQDFRWTYPLDETVALDGNWQLGKDFLLRFELAYTRDKSYSIFHQGRIGYLFRSDQYNLLLGTDKTFKNNLYFNIQGLLSHIPDMKGPTPVQIHVTEALTTIQLRKGFRSETLFVEFNGLSNLTTGEYLLTPQISLQKTDWLKFVGGVHLNGRSTERLGPIGQFDKNNTPFFETHVIF